jgi:hypothetical protein
MSGKDLFFSLPAELRQQLYTYVFPTHQTLTFRPIWLKVGEPGYENGRNVNGTTVKCLVSPDGVVSGVPTLLRLCKQINIEASPLLSRIYETCTFRFYVTRAFRFVDGVMSPDAERIPIPNNMPVFEYGPHFNTVDFITATAFKKITSLELILSSPWTGISTWIENIVVNKIGYNPTKLERLMIMLQIEYGAFLCDTSGISVYNKTGENLADDTDTWLCDTPWARDHVARQTAHEMVRLRQSQHLYEFALLPFLRIRGVKKAEVGGYVNTNFKNQLVRAMTKPAARWSFTAPTGQSIGFISDEDED